MKSNYRLIARAYATCEKLVFGSALQRCRTAFITELPQNILSVGEGDGRFSQALLQARPDIRLQIIEPDAAMRTESLKRNPDLTFVTSETASPCDAIVLNFVLDLFTKEEAETFLGQLPTSQALIVGDFFPSETQGNIRRRAAHYLVWIMYRFFSLTTGLKTNSLPPTHEILTSQGWILREEHTQWTGFISAQWWEKPAIKG